MNELKGSPSFGMMLREFRARCIDRRNRLKNLTQERLGILLGEKLGYNIRRDTISEWENGKSRIPVEDRHLLLAIITTLYKNGGLKDLQEADQFLHAGGYMKLQREEIASINAEWLPITPSQIVSDEVASQKVALPFGSFDFSSLIAERTADFVGREHVFNAIEGFVNDQKNGYFVISGDPGIGKSTVVAEYVKRTNCLSHFNVRAMAINQPSQFIENLAFQLISRYGLEPQPTDSPILRDGYLLATLLEQASQRLKPGENLVIVIDALDEVQWTSQPPGTNILFLPPQLPQGVYIILTKRRVELPLVVHSPLVEFDFESYQKSNLQDAHDFVMSAAGQDNLKAWVANRDLSPEVFANTLTEKSEGNFMFLRHVVWAMQYGIYKDALIEEIPNGLMAYYTDHWTRMGMTKQPLPKEKLLLIYVLAEARKPISVELLADLTELDQLSAQAVIETWMQFLHTEFVDKQARYSIYHDSFQSFLRQKEIIKKAQISLEDINGQIGEVLWQAYEDLRD